MTTLVSPVSQPVLEFFLETGFSIFWPVYHQLSFSCRAKFYLCNPPVNICTTFFRWYINHKDHSLDFKSKVRHAGQMGKTKRKFAWKKIIWPGNHQHTLDENLQLHFYIWFSKWNECDWYSSFPEGYNTNDFSVMPDMGGQVQGSLQDQEKPGSQQPGDLSREPGSGI